MTREDESLFRRCSFCGKSEADVARLIAGGGRQPLGMLPAVFICDQCVDLCAAIVSGQPTQGDVLQWSPFCDADEDFEWAAVLQADGSTFVVIRHGGENKSVGGVLASGESVCTEKARAILRTLRDRL